MAKIFRRYRSEIHGNYRVAYLKYGLLTGVVMSLYLFLRHWIGHPLPTPSDLVKDFILIAAIVLFTYVYRKGLPDRRVTFKELILMGMGIGLVAALVYGLALWLYCGVAYPDMTEAYAAGFRTEESSSEGYLAALNPAMWAFFYGFLHTVVTSIIVAFFAALVFRTEKGERVN